MVLLDTSARQHWLIVAITTPAFVIFLSSNVVNAGNLFFNILFSRWMGPELFGDLALILTIKLSILGVLGAVQMAVSQRISGDTSGDLGSLARLNGFLFIGLWFLLPVVLAGFFLTEFDKLISISSPISLVILLFSIPFAAPLSILRGIAFGAQRTGKIVLTANVEMAVRLFGSIIAWKAGIGLDGVVFAIGLSIVAGWAVLADMLPFRSRTSPETGGYVKSLGYAAYPFAVLQLSQVISLDGEIFLASAFLAPADAGYVGALSLFQRVEFFACFGLASVLLPSVIRAAGDRKQIRQAASPVALIYLCVVIPFILLVWAAPQTLISILVGNEFLAVTSSLLPAAFSAAAFTLSYLLATLLVALDDRRGIWLIAFTAGVQLCAMAIASQNSGIGFSTLLVIKAVIQSALLGSLLVLMVLKFMRIPASQTTPD